VASGVDPPAAASGSGGSGARKGTIGRGLLAKILRDTELTAGELQSVL
jgi:hypothetical protein